MKLYSQLLEVLIRLGVRYIFGVPGDAINPLIEALRRQQEIKFIHVNHEEAGAFAASAQAKLTGRLAVCVGTVGPGAIHLLNGLYDARKDHAPVLAIAGQVPSVEIGFAYHQEVNLDALFNDVAVYHKTINNPQQMPRIAIEACTMALHRHGVAVLTIPHDVGNQSVSDEPFNVPEVGTYDIIPTTAQFGKVIELIDKAEKVTILYGEGCRGAEKDLISLSSHLSAPLVFSLKAKDLIPYDHELVAGNIGLIGTRGGVKAIENCDLLLILGSDFPYRNWYPHGVPIIHIDHNPVIFGRRLANEIGVTADCALLIRRLLDKTKNGKPIDHLASAQKAKASWDKGMLHLEDTARSPNLIHPQALARMLGAHADPDALFTCDTGAVTVWAARHLAVNGRQRFTCSFNLASMAYALPAAIGAQLAFPERQVISLSGDGGFNMLMGDLLTAVKYQLPIKVVIFNNGKLGLIKMEQEAEGYPEQETDLLNPDYALLAQSFGIAGASVSEPSALKGAIVAALSHPGPYLLDVRINPDEITMPPKIELAQVWGFGKAKLAEAIGSLFGG